MRLSPVWARCASEPRNHATATVAPIPCKPTRPVLSARRRWLSSTIASRSTRAVSLIEGTRILATRSSILGGKTVTTALDATSPAWWPPTPSETINRLCSRATRHWSSFCGRTRPTSLTQAACTCQGAACSFVVTVRLSRFLQCFRQCIIHLTGMLIAFAGLDGQGTVDYLCNLCWNMGVALADRHDLAIQDDLHLVRCATVIARVRAREDIVASSSHRPDIAHGLEEFEIDDLLAGHKRKRTSIAA